MSDSKFSGQAARAIAAQLYVAKRLNKEPAKMIRFIQLNRSYFPSISDEDIKNLKLEQNITDEDVLRHQESTFVDFSVEDP